MTTDAPDAGQQHERFPACCAIHIIGLTADGQTGEPAMGELIAIARDGASIKAMAPLEAFDHAVLLPADPIPGAPDYLFGALSPGEPGPDGLPTAELTFHAPTIEAAEALGLI